MEKTNLLKKILDANQDEQELAATIESQVNIDMDRDMSQKAAPAGFCVECEDQPTEVYCENCQDDYCSVCFQAQHRKGKRKNHLFKKLQNDQTHEKAVIVQELQTKDVEMDQDVQYSPVKGSFGDWFTERTKYIPMRLSLNERKYLRLLEAALAVSEYTDKIDIISYTSKPKRIVAQIKELCSILSGLVLAADYKEGQQLFESKDFHDNAAFYQKMKV